MQKEEIEIKTEEQITSSNRFESVGIPSLWLSFLCPRDKKRSGPCTMICQDGQHLPPHAFPSLQQSGSPEPPSLGPQEVSVLHQRIKDMEDDFKTRELELKSALMEKLRETVSSKREVDESRTVRERELRESHARMQDLNLQVRPSWTHREEDRHHQIPATPLN